MDYTPDPGAVVRMPPMPLPARNRGPLIALIVGVALLALLIGIGIGRATVEAPAPVTGTTAPTIERSKLKVISTPADGNVIVDGRFVGVAPLENLDVDPGKHSIVIDLFGYQPYAGTVEIDPNGRAKLSVVLAPLGDNTGTSTAKINGGGTTTRVVVPPSALAPATITDSPKSTKKPGTGGGTVASGGGEAPAPPRYVPPPRPKRDCSHENYICRDGCSRADTDCRFSCQGCSSCSSSVGWDKCKQMCDTCRAGCEQNKRFCETSCETQQRTCDASNAD